jgi:thioredoxin 1
MKKKMNVMILLVAMMFVAVSCNAEKAKQNEVAESVEVVADPAKVETAEAQALPKVIDFYATWCGPCKMIAPIIEELATEYEGKVIFEKVDVDENSAMAQEYDVEAIPTLVFMKVDGTYEKTVGFKDKEAIKAEIAKIME